MGEAPPASAYQLFAVRYGTRKTKKSEVYLNYHIYGVPDEPIEMDYFFWIAQRGDEITLIDCGFNRASGERRGRTMLHEPVDALLELGIDVGVVSRVVVTHAHYDHIGNLARFPGAEVVISRREFDFWTGPYGRRRQFASSAEPDDIACLEDARRQGRITFVSGEHDVAPGIQVVEVGGHTPGQLVVVASTETGEVILASDAVHYYEEYERDWPFAIVADVEGMYRTFDYLREMTRDGSRALVAGHDPDVMNRFPGRPDGRAGLAVRVG